MHSRTSVGSAGWSPIEFEWTEGLRSLRTSRDMAVCSSLTAEFSELFVVCPEEELVLKNYTFVLWHCWLFTSVIASPVTSDTLGKRLGPWDTVISTHGE